MLWDLWFVILMAAGYHAWLNSLAYIHEHTTDNITDGTIVPIIIPHFLVNQILAVIVQVMKQIEPLSLILSYTNTFSCFVFRNIP